LSVTVPPDGIALASKASQYSLRLVTPEVKADASLTQVFPALSVMLETDADAPVRKAVTTTRSSPALVPIPAPTVIGRVDAAAVSVAE